ncbi:unnamed protein product [Caenorhabditis brenneri]
MKVMIQDERLVVKAGTEVYPVQKIELYENASQVYIIWPDDVSRKEVAGNETPNPIITVVCPRRKVAHKKVAPKVQQTGKKLPRKENIHDLFKLLPPQSCTSN